MADAINTPAYGSTLFHSSAGTSITPTETGKKKKHGGKRCWIRKSVLGMFYEMLTELLFVYMKTPQGAFKCVRLSLCKD